MTIPSILNVLFKQFVRSSSDKGITLALAVLLFFAIYQFLSYVAFTPLLQTIGTEFEQIPYGLFLTYHLVVFVIVSTAYSFYHIRIPHYLFDFPLPEKGVYIAYHIPFFAGMILFFCLHIGFYISLFEHMYVPVNTVFFFITWFLLTILVTLLSIYLVVIARTLANMCRPKIWVEIASVLLLVCAYAGLQWVTYTIGELRFLQSGYWAYSVTEGEWGYVLVLLVAVIGLMVLAPSIFAWMNKHMENKVQAVHEFSFRKSTPANMRKLIAVDLWRNKDKKNQSLLVFS